MRIKIISDGTDIGTKIVDAETMAEVEGCREVHWSMDSKLGVAEAFVEFSGVEVDIEAEVLEEYPEDAKVTKIELVQTEGGAAFVTVEASDNDPDAVEAVAKIAEIIAENNEVENGMFEG